MKKFYFKFVLVFASLIMSTLNGVCQTVIPVELTGNALKEQIKYLEEHTRIYENYRAIREDMYQKLNKNILDSLIADQSKIADLKNLTNNLKTANDSLKNLLVTTTGNLEEMTSTKNSIKVIGIDINKGTYNSIMWIIVAGLICTLAIGFLIFKKYLITSIRTGKELEKLRQEFEAYRQSSRIAREKLEMDHFNEIKKLKGK
jgi:uncharacterized membrane-anchored protein YhcB (DUF1043 family)